MRNQEILSFLQDQKGGYVSGEAISRKLGISRSAVWKQVQSLRSRGYQIQGSPRLGYKLSVAPTAFSKEEIGSRLKTRFFGRNLICLQCVESTNDLAGDLARKECPEGTVVVAERQTAGRGRFQRGWFSPEGAGLWFSLVLRPQLPPTVIPQLTLVAGVAVAEAICEMTGIRPGVKWPNDLLVDEKKLCGILLEMDATAEMVNHLVLGIGINVNQEESQFPEELRDTAVSMKIVSGRQIERIPLFCRLLEKLEEAYICFCTNGFQRARSLWLDYQVTLGKNLRVSDGRREYFGRAVGLSEDGRLIILLADGSIYHCASGEVFLESNL